MDEPLEHRIGSLNFMLAAWGAMMTAAGIAIYGGLQGVERENYSSVNLLNVTDWAPHFFLAAGIPMILAYTQSRYGYAAAGTMGALNVCHELAQRYSVIPGGFQLEDVIAGTLGAALAYGATKLSYIAPERS